MYCLSGNILVLMVVNNIGHLSINHEPSLRKKCPFEKRVPFIAIVPKGIVLEPFFPIGSKNFWL